MAVSWVLSVAGFAAVAERAGVLAAFGPSVEVVAESTGSVGSKVRKGAPVRIMVPTSTNGTTGFGLPRKFHEIKLRVPFPPIGGKIVGCFPMEIDVVREPCKARELPLG